MANTSLEQYVEQTTASVAPLKQESIALLTEAKQIVVIDNVSLAAAVAMKKRISAQNTSVETARKQFTAPLDNVKSQLMDLERDVKVELDEAKTYIAGQILDYEEEQLRLKEQEAARIEGIVTPFNGGVESLNITSLKDMGSGAKNTYKALSDADKENPVVKQAFLGMIARITNRIALLEEQERQAAEDERLAKVAAEQSAEAAALARQKAENEAAARQVERDRQELAQRQQQQALADERRAQEEAEAKAAKAAPKTNSTTYFDFEIVDASKVPSAYLMPDEKKIREAIKQSKGRIIIGGVAITKRRASR